MIICEHCQAEIVPGEVHDPELCARLASFVSSAQRHKNFNQQRPVMPSCMATESIKSKRPVKTPVARTPAEDQLPPSDRAGYEPPGMLTARKFDQRAFADSGAADSADARLWDFFFDAHGHPKPENFNVWFKSSLLEDFIKTSRRMNNRAVSFRERSRPLGLELDNCMMRPGPNAPVSSHYRLCPIEASLHLSAEEKEKLIAACARNL